MRPLAGAFAPPPRRRCKFGCGRAAHASAVRSFDTCCRRCGLCQGGGDHDASCAGGHAQASFAATAPSSPSGGGRSEAAALVTADLALELRRRAQACEQAGDAEGARSLWADSLDGLRAAADKAPPGGTAARLLERLLLAAEAAPHGGRQEEETNATFECEVDAELERLLAQLDAVAAASKEAGGGAVGVAAAGAVAMLCKFGCKHLVAPGLAKDGRPYQTCCRSCAFAKGGGAHDASCSGWAAAVPETRELALASDAVEAYTGDAEIPQDRGSAAARAALRELGLDDEWPTSLTLREVRRRYMREALRCHPDKGCDEERLERTERFQRLSAAFSILELQLSLVEEGPLPPAAGNEAAFRGTGVGAAALAGTCDAGASFLMPRHEVTASTGTLALPPAPEEAIPPAALATSRPLPPLPAPGGSIFGFFLCTAPDLQAERGDVVVADVPTAAVPAGSSRWPTDLF